MSMDILENNHSRFNSDIFDEFSDKQASKRIVEYIKNI